MFEHISEKGCSGFSVEVLEEISPGLDIAAVEDLHILTMNPSLNKEPRLDPLALYNLFMFTVLKNIKK